MFFTRCSPSNSNATPTLFLTWLETLRVTQMRPRLGEGLQACGDVDAVAVNRFVGLFDHVAQIDPNAELHAPVRFEFDVVPFHGLLDLDGGLDRLDRAWDSANSASPGALTTRPSWRATRRVMMSR